MQSIGKSCHGGFPLSFRRNEPLAVVTFYEVGRGRSRESAAVGIGAAPDCAQGNRRTDCRTPTCLRRFATDRDETAFAVLVQRHGPLVWAVCRHLLPHETDAEDAFQATFLTLVRSAGSGRNPSALGAWLHSVACRVASNAKRAAGRRRKREQTAAATEAVAPVSQTAWHDLQVAVHEEVRDAARNATDRVRIVRTGRPRPG